ncbi:hypothetical protein ACFL2T_04895 [Elusimicrobiota bacterium]
MRFQSLLLILALAVVAAKLPSYVRQQAPLPADTPSAEEDADEDELMAFAERRAASAGVELTPQHRAAIRAATSKSEMIRNPVLDKLLSMPKRPSLGRAFSARGSVVAETLEPFAGAIRILLWAALAIIFISYAASAFLGLTGLTRFVSKVGHRLASLWLVWLSVVAATLLVLAKVDIWASLPGDGQLAAVLILLASAGALKSLDHNAPVWNSTVTGLATPIAVSLLVLGYLRFLAA